jgi:hypothetical protein
MRTEEAVQSLHDHYLRQVARNMDADRDFSEGMLQLDQLCWVLDHGYCVAQR